jgi:hypothetical protein
MKVGSNTPWGRAQRVENYARGFCRVFTASHGGYLLGRAFAEKHLTQAAIERGAAWGSYLAYEEDCAASIILHEIAVEFIPGFDVEVLDLVFESLSLWCPDYLLERGIQPEAERYARWLERQEEGQLRAMRSPDLIVSALGLQGGVVRVWTADGAVHHVTAESYRTRLGVNRLSKCKLDPAWAGCERAA